jgi:excisionase family DNA binding protein
MGQTVFFIISGGKVETTYEVLKDQLKQDRLLTVSEVASLVGLTSKTMLRYIQEGRISAVRFGPRSYRIPTSSLLIWLEDVGLTRSLDIKKEM